MNVYGLNDIDKILSVNTYPGRGIIIGKAADGASAVFAYFIMGRSDNSRNRVFEKTEDGIIIYPFDAAKVKDPSLIIYSPVRRLENKIIVTNGDQTDTVYEGLKLDVPFETSLECRCFEPDAPNYTPRISGIIKLNKNSFDYKLSILKSADAEGNECNRYTFSYAPIDGVGHFIHTYHADGNPIPTFQGEPERINIPSDIDEFTKKIWNGLNEDNKISLYVSYISLTDGSESFRLINKNK